jgi:hypothetical protein
MVFELCAETMEACLAAQGGGAEERVRIIKRTLREE